MKRFLYVGGLLVLMLAVALALGCGGDDTPTAPDDDDDNPLPTNLPLIPTPSSVNDLLPAVSDDLIVGLSDELPDFQPEVTELCMMQDDGTAPWSPMNRRLILACAGVLPEYTGDPDIVDDRSYISARPHLAHERYWRKIRQVTLDPGNSSYQYQETITSGTSTTHEESREFSQTMGIEVTVGGGWGPFSASVTASYEQTETVGEVNSVTFDEETSITETYTVQADPTRTTVYAIWQLVDRFRMVDADTVDIDQSETLTHAVIQPVGIIEFPNREVIYQSTTFFD